LVLELVVVLVGWL